MNVILLEKQSYISYEWGLLIALIASIAIISLVIAMLIVYIMIDNGAIEYMTIITAIALIMCSVAFGVKSYNLYKSKSTPSIKLVVDKDVSYQFIDENYDILKYNYPYFIVKDNGMMDEK